VADVSSVVHLTFYDCSRGIRHSAGIRSTSMCDRVIMGFAQEFFFLCVAIYRKIAEKKLTKKLTKNVRIAK